MYISDSESFLKPYVLCSSKVPQKQNIEMFEENWGHYNIITLGNPSRIDLHFRERAKFTGLYTKRSHFIFFSHQNGFWIAIFFELGSQDPFFVTHLFPFSFFPFFN